MDALKKEISLEVAYAVAENEIPFQETTD